MNTYEIQKRYGSLAEESCCLSCGDTAKHSGARRGEICLDLGSGRGTEALRLSELVGEEGFVYGVDISGEMLKKAEETSVKLGVKNVKFIRSEIDCIPLSDACVDLVISNCSINHAADKQKVWDEIFRVLKTGGRFIVSDIYAEAEVPEEYRKDPSAVAECWAGADTKENYIETLKRSGFGGLEIIDESRPYDKGKIRVASWTIAGRKNACCSGRP